MAYNMSMKRRRKPHTRRNHNKPLTLRMLVPRHSLRMLGDDYMALKLAGQIRIPRGGYQINLDDGQ